MLGITPLSSGDFFVSLFVLFCTTLNQVLFWYTFRNLLIQNTVFHTSLFTNINQNQLQKYLQLIGIEMESFSPTTWNICFLWKLSLLQNTKCCFCCCFSLAGCWISQVFQKKKKCTWNSQENILDKCLQVQLFRKYQIGWEFCKSFTRKCIYTRNNKYAFHFSYLHYESLTRGAYNLQCNQWQFTEGIITCCWLWLTFSCT